MTASFSLANRTALVTGVGAPDGIGFAVARQLLKQGARVVITATSNRVNDRAAELRASDDVNADEVTSLIADLTDADAET